MWLGSRMRQRGGRRRHVLHLSLCTKEWVWMTGTGRKQTVNTVYVLLLHRVLIYTKHLCVLLLHLRLIILIIVCLVLLTSSASLLSYPTLGKVQDTTPVQCLDCVLCFAHWHVPKDLVHSRQLICLERFLQVLREPAEKVPAYLQRIARIFDVHAFSSWTFENELLWWWTVGYIERNDGVWVLGHELNLL